MFSSPRGSVELLIVDLIGCNCQHWGPDTQAGRGRSGARRGPEDGCPGSPDPSGGYGTPAGSFTSPGLLALVAGASCLLLACFVLMIGQSGRSTLYFSSVTIHPEHCTYALTLCTKMCKLEFNTTPPKTLRSGCQVGQGHLLGQDGDRTLASTRFELCDLNRKDEDNPLGCKPRSLVPFTHRTATHRRAHQLRVLRWARGKKGGAVPRPPDHSQKGPPLCGPRWVHVGLIYRSKVIFPKAILGLWNRRTDSFGPCRDCFDLLGRPEIPHLPKHGLTPPPTHHPENQLQVLHGTQQKPAWCHGVTCLKN